MTGNWHGLESNPCSSTYTIRVKFLLSKQTPTRIDVSTLRRVLVVTYFGTLYILVSNSNEAFLFNSTNQRCDSEPVSMCVVGCIYMCRYTGKRSTVCTDGRTVVTLANCATLCVVDLRVLDR